MLRLSPSYSSAVKVRLPSLDVFANIGMGSERTVYSGIRFGSDGKIYRATIPGAWQATGQAWLLDGAASGYYLKRAVLSGASLATDAGDLQQMNSNLDFVITTTGIPKITTLEFSISDDTAGSNLIVTNTYLLNAERETTL